MSVLELKKTLLRYGTTYMTLLNLIFLVYFIKNDIYEIRNIIIILNLIVIVLSNYIVFVYPRKIDVDIGGKVLSVDKFYLTLSHFIFHYLLFFTILALLNYQNIYTFNIQKLNFYNFLLIVSPFIYLSFFNTQYIYLLSNKITIFTFILFYSFLPLFYSL